MPNNENAADMLENEEAVVRFKEDHKEGVRDMVALRRLDWRFLLPYAELKRVAYIGPKDPELVRALNEYSDAFYEIPALIGDGGVHYVEQSFDLVVSRSVVKSDLALARNLLKPSGYLYWEIDCRSWLSKLLMNCVVLVKKLKAQGFGDINIYWPRPNFGQCIEIIPLDDRQALDFIFERNTSVMADRFRRAIGRTLMRLRLLKFVIPGISVIASPESPLS